MTAVAYVQTRAPRTSVTSPVARRDVAEQMPLPAGVGSLAGTDTPHQFAPLDMTQCAPCFGWRDDPRHL